MANDNIDNNEMITSFSNPNYTPNYANQADALNSNLLSSNYCDDNGHIYDTVSDDGPTGLMSEVTNNGGADTPSKSRKQYAHLDLTSMGMDGVHASGGVISSPDSMTTPDSEGLVSADSALTSPAGKTSRIVDIEHTEEEDGEDESPYGETRPSQGFLGYYASLEMSGKNRQEPPKNSKATGKAASNPVSPSKKRSNKEPLRYDDKTKYINSPDSNDSGIQADVQHISGPLNEDIYAVVSKPRKPPAKNLTPSTQEEAEGEDDSETLPPGWERHEDEDGPYFWHIKSGTIQREPPPPAAHSTHQEPPKRSVSSTSDGSESSSGTGAQPDTPSSSENHLQEFEGHAFKYAAESLKTLTQNKHDGSPTNSDDGRQPIRFAVRSLGWVGIAEDDLTPEKSSKAVNRCIVDLSIGRNDINDVVGRWGDGKDLFMDLDNQMLTLIDPQDMSVLNVQPIHSIRVWGVGRDNGRDFAYVARDRETRRHMCHVFRCDTPARQIANTLRDICQKIMLKRNLQQQHTSTQRAGASRPNHLPNLEKAGHGEQMTFEQLFKTTSFPTPMEEPKKVLRCHYLGTAQVSKPAGVEVLNSATEKVYARVPPEKWVFVSVAIAPSTITISEHGKSENVLAECRVRFLSFMGIAMRNVKLCSFIMHTAQDNFIAHVFHCEPSAGALCKTIEAACKLRYQKCLDSHHDEVPDESGTSSHQQQKSLTASLKAGVHNVASNVISRLKKKTTNKSSSDT